MGRGRGCGKGREREINVNMETQWPKRKDRPEGWLCVGMRESQIKKKRGERG